MCEFKLHLQYLINALYLVGSSSDEFWLTGCDAQSAVHIYQHVKGTNFPQFYR